MPSAPTLVAAELLHVASERQDVEALLPAAGRGRRAGQLGHAEAAEIESRHVEAPLVERADGDLTDVVEAARGEEPVDDDQRWTGRLLQRDGGGDPLAVRSLDDVVLELARVAVADHRSLAVLGDYEVGDVGEALPELREVRVAQVLRDRLQVLHEGVHRALALRRNRERPPAALLQAHQEVPNAAADQLAEEPERQQHQTEQDVRELRRPVQDAVLALSPCQSLPHTAASPRPRRRPAGLQAVADRLDDETLGALVVLVGGRDRLEDPAR